MFAGEAWNDSTMVWRHATNRVGIGTSDPDHTLHLVGAFKHQGVRINTRMDETISSGVLDVDLTNGPYIRVVGEGGTDDNLDKILVNGVAPTVGTELYLTRGGSYVITLRTYSHASVTEEAGTFFGRSAPQAGGSVSDPIKTLAITSGYTIVHIMYAGSAWVIMNPECNTSTL